MIVLTWWAMAWTIAGVRANLAAYGAAVHADTRRPPAQHPADGVPPALPAPARVSSTSRRAGSVGASGKRDAERRLRRAGELNKGGFQS